MLTQLLGGDFANLKMIYFERNEQSFKIFDDSAVMSVRGVCVCVVASFSQHEPSVEQ